MHKRRLARRGKSIAVATIMALAAGTAIAQTAGGGDTAGLPPASGAAVARLDARLSQLEQDLRGVTGRVESLNYQVRQLNDRLERMSSDLEMRLNEMKGGTPAAAAAPPASSVPAGTSPSPSGSGGGPTVLSRSAPAEPERPTPPPSAPPAAPSSPPPTGTGSQGAAAGGGLPAGSSKEQYAYAFSLMQKGSYPEATAAFGEFIDRNPDDSLVDNARYWLGESYYARNEYARAAETFLDAYEKNKSGPKAPDTLLKLGMALGKLDKKKEACASFRELNKAFPNASAQIKDKASQESQRIGC